MVACQHQGLRGRRHPLQVVALVDILTDRKFCVRVAFHRYHREDPCRAMEETRSPCTLIRRMPPSLRILVNRPRLRPQMKLKPPMTSRARRQLSFSGIGSPIQKLMLLVYLQILHRTHLYQLSTNSCPSAPNKHRAVIMPYLTSLFKHLRNHRHLPPV